MGRVLLILLAVVGFVAIVRKVFASSALGRDAKCFDCIHCRKLFRDGVRCGFGEREVFKTPAHIEMCPDYEPMTRK